MNGSILNKYVKGDGINMSEVLDKRMREKLNSKEDGEANRTAREAITEGSNRREEDDKSKIKVKQSGRNQVQRKLRGELAL